MKPIPNICPACGYPLTPTAQCTSPHCEDAQYCEYCDRRLSIGGVCPNRLCLNAICEYCNVYLNPDGVCPNETCPNALKTDAVRASAPTPCDPVFTSPTERPAAPDDDDFLRFTIPCPPGQGPYADKSLASLLPPPPSKFGEEAASAIRPVRPAAPELEIGSEPLDDLDDWMAAALREENA